MVEIVGSQMRARHGFESSRVCKILLQETLPWIHEEEEEETEIIVLHLNRPLEGGVPVPVPEDSAEVDKATLQRYLAVIRAYPESELPMHQLDQFLVELKSYCENHDIVTQGIKLSQVMREHWRVCTIQLLQCGTFREAQTDAQPKIQLQIEQVIESYMAEKMHRILFEHVRRVKAEQETHLVRIMYSMRHFTQTDLGINAKLQVR